MPSKKKKSLAATRRTKAAAQARDQAWIDRALQAGISQRLVNLRYEVCALSTTEYKFVCGMHAGDEGDKSQFGCAILKCSKQLKRGRSKGQLDVTKRAPKRSSAAKMLDKMLDEWAALDNPPPPPTDLDELLQQLDAGGAAAGGAAAGSAAAGSSGDFSYLGLDFDAAHTLAGELPNNGPTNVAL